MALPAEQTPKVRKPTPKATVPEPQEATPAVGVASVEADRLLALALHEENILNNRLNIFLVAESILLVLAAEIANSAPAVRDPICYAGLAITAVWLLSTWRQWWDLHLSGIALREAWPALRVAYKRNPKWLKVANLIIMLVGLPLIFTWLWLLILELPAVPSSS